MTAMKATETDRLRFPPLQSAEIERRLARITELDGVVCIIVYGSCAKGTARPDSDVDVAVFFRSGVSLLERYHALVRICCCPEADIQPQAFYAEELNDPCGIIEEIVRYGVVVYQRS
jgi:tRNA nucleotidyltransferase (CCA-adding enzyme)